MEGEKLHSGLVDTNDLHLNLLSCPEAKKKKRQPPHGATPFLWKLPSCMVKK